MSEIIIDTETTGLTRLSYANRFNYKQWPRMVQIAWALVDQGEITHRESYLIEPKGYTIPPQATQIHGITQEQSEKEGHGITQVFDKLDQALDQAKVVIAHNLNFDLGIIESEALRIERKIQLPEKRICTVHLAQKYLREVKGIRQGGFPKLGQFYEMLFGFSYGPKHDANNDVTACYHIYKRLQQLGIH